MTIASRLGERNSPIAAEVRLPAALPSDRPAVPGDILSRSELPVSLRKLIESHIRSAADVDVILLLYRTERDWTATDVARELRIDGAQAAEMLTRLVRRGLLVPVAGGYRYSPRTPSVGEAVTELARFYPTYRVAIVSWIYARPSWPITDFSDAFRLRNED